MPAPQYTDPSGKAVYGTHIADPNGGATVDTQARAAISSILAVFEAAGMVPPR
jgi:hypothetical protein